ncbi:uncharacterized protein LOC123211098 isoform X2 [Mangifera indica]|uniref:uncharacterized protein LOC123211098 isoform X2 n=1 Tax=Mangifera indica TaxID=29780 RepID=UPI001CFC2ACA|nr:uncharacterized protein LOC123211098 isoform X2 [Mangifera indica]
MPGHVVNPNFDGQNPVQSVYDYCGGALDSPSDGKRWDVESDHPTQVVKDLGSCKWSDDLEEDNAERSKVVKGNLNSLSWLFQTYGNKGKSVHCGDQVGDTGFFYR